MDDYTRIPPEFPRGAIPWWVRLSRWLNGSRVCTVPDCIELTAPEAPYCQTHTRMLRARLGERRCRIESCAQPRTGEHPFCPEHLELDLIQRTHPATRWNTGPIPDPVHGTAN